MAKAKSPNQKLHVRVPAEVIEWVDAEVTARGWSRNAVVGIALGALATGRYCRQGPPLWAADEFERLRRAWQKGAEPDELRALGFYVPSSAAGGGGAAGRA